MGGVRRWLHHRWLPPVLGAIVGLIIAASLSVSWQRSFDQSAVTLLGSGHGLSALVSTASGRVLIVSGDDPIAFANAWRDARPPTMRRTDVVVLTPGASPLVAERAVELTNPNRIMAIMSREEEPDTPDIPDPIRLIGAPRTIELADSLLIDIDPGLIAGRPVDGWTIRVQSASATILLAESAPYQPSPDIGLIAIMGKAVPSAILSLASPVAIAADATGTASTAHGRIEPGSAHRIPIKESSIIIPRAWVRERSD